MNDLSRIVCDFWYDHYYILHCWYVKFYYWKPYVTLKAKKGMCTYHLIQCVGSCFCLSYLWSEDQVYMTTSKPNDIHIIDSSC